MPLIVNPYDYTSCEICGCELEVGSDEHMTFEKHPKYTHICMECYDEMEQCEKCEHEFKTDDLFYNEDNGCEYCESCYETIGEE